MVQKIIKTGNSLAITIPSNLAKILGLRPGQSVESKVDLGLGTLTHTFHNTGQLPLFKRATSS